MKFRKIEFKNFEAQIVYNKYIKNTKRAIKKLPKKEQEDLLMELNSHIFESIQNRESSDELQIINEIVDQLGAPKETWSEIGIEKNTIRNKNTPKNLNMNTLKSFAQNFKLGTLYTLSYTLLVFSIGLISLKIHFGEKMGLYYKKGEYFVLGGIDFGDGIYAPEYEILGIWYIPFWTVCFMLSYYFIKELKKEEKQLELKNLELK